jgi:ribosomal protein L37AE/L43A
LIIKGRKIPLIILYKEALLRRIPLNSPRRPKIEGDLLRYWAGYHGECKVDRYLSTINSKDFLILNDLHIPIGDTSIQIDTLLIFQSFILVLEVKNISGLLNIGGEFDQFSRTTHNGNVEGFTNPVLQAERYCYHLSQWLQDKKFPVLPIDYLVVFTNENSVLNSLPHSNHINSKITRVEGLIPKISTLRKRYSQPILNEKEIKRISKQLIKAHINFPIISKIEDTIITGVQCKACRKFEMKRKRGSWFCEKCNVYEKNAHEQAINDYFLLVSSSINNSQAREFLHLHSSKITQNLLSSMNLATVGKNKGKIYLTPYQ